MRIWETINLYSKPKKLNLGPKKLYLGLWAGMLKNNCHICKQHTPIFLTAKVFAKIRIHKFGTKNVLFVCFWQQFRKHIFTFAFSILEFVLLQGLVQKTKILKSGTKSARFPYFGAWIWKYYCHIWSQYPGICLDIKFSAKIKILKFGIKDAWFGYFGAGIWK